MLHDFLKDLARRRTNQILLSLLEKRVCPECGEEAIHQVGSGWECFHCHTTYGAVYQHSSPVQKPESYKDSAGIADVIPTADTNVVPFPNFPYAA